MGINFTPFIPEKDVNRTVSARTTIISLAIRSSQIDPFRNRWVVKFSICLLLKRRSRDRYKSIVNIFRFLSTLYKYNEIIFSQLIQKWKDNYLGRAFEVREIVFSLAPTLSSFCSHSSVFQVSFITNNDKLKTSLNKITISNQLNTGNVSGSRGDAWIRNSSRQDSSDLNEFGAVVSYTRTQQSAPR